jgi:large subunit ribosomal protein L13
MAKSEHIIDVKNQPLGRAASRIALLLQGKDKASYEQRKVGDAKVIVKNIKLIKMTGKKATQKIYYSHTTQLGHLKKRKYADIFERKPDWVLWHAVKGMLPKNALQAKRLRKLIIEK